MYIAPDQLLLGVRRSPMRFTGVLLVKVAVMVNHDPVGMGLLPQSKTK